MVEPRLIESGDEDKRPYAPAANVLGVIDRVRRLNLPATVDTDFLRLADVPEGSLGRVAFALRFLGLTDPNTRPTDQLRAMARATEDEYRELLAGVVRAAYAVDFQRIDPAEESQTKIAEAFRRYEPRSQTTRMVMLFLGLAKAAGIPVLDAPRDRGNQAGRSVVARAGVARGKGSANPVRVRVSSPPVQGELGQHSPPNVLFGVTVDDIAALPDSDFKAVWDALGIVAQARARSLTALQDMSDQAAARRDAEEKVGGDQ
jgi:hypothetical protein